jgi:ankyrin repeat protein
MAIIGQDSEDLLAELIRSKADVNSVNKFCETPLHWAAQIGNCSFISLLLEHQANPQIRDNGMYFEKTWDCSWWQELILIPPIPVQMAIYHFIGLQLLDTKKLYNCCQKIRI